jgi:hypothetical protein
LGYASCATRLQQLMPCSQAVAAVGLNIRVSRRAHLAVRVRRQAPNPAAAILSYTRNLYPAGTSIRRPNTHRHPEGFLHVLPF